MEKLTAINMRLDTEDAELLREAVTLEKLTQSDVMRRALRHYAREVLHLEQKPKTKKKR